MKMRSAVHAFSMFFVLSACTASVRDTNEIVIQGSDTEVQLVSSLVEAFTQARPQARISVAGGGSAVGIAALINGETDIANSSRAMKPEEIATAKEKGRDPKEFILARDGLSVIVHPNNPLTTLSMTQVAKLFKGEITNWKEIGGPDKTVVLYGRQSTSGTFGFFRDTVLKGDYAQTMRQMEGSQAIVDAVVADEQGVGYVGVGYVADQNGTVKPGIKVLTISQEEGGTAVSPLDMASVMSGKYPIFRRIYQYMPGLPGSGALLTEFLAFEASPEGLRIVREQGFYPVTAADAVLNKALLDAIR